MAMTAAMTSRRDRSDASALCLWPVRGMTKADRNDVLRIALALSGVAVALPRKVTADFERDLLELLLPERLRPTAGDRKTSLVRSPRGGGSPHLQPRLPRARHHARRARYPARRLRRPCARVRANTPPFPAPQPPPPGPRRPCEGAQEKCEHTLLGSLPEVASWEELKYVINKKLPGTAAVTASRWHVRAPAPAAEVCLD